MGSGSKILDPMLAINLRSSFVLARATAPSMLLRGKGSIVNVVARAVVDHPPGLGADAARKAAALDGFSRGRSEGHRSTRKLDLAQYHRYAGESEGDAQRGLRDLVKA